MSSAASAEASVLALGDQHLGEAERGARERGDLAGHPHHRERVRPVRGDLDVEDPVVQAQISHEVGAERRLRGQQQEPAVIVADSQLLLRAQDPFRDDPADLGRLHLAQPGQSRPRRREGRARARRRVGRAADHRVAAIGQRHPHEPVVVAGRAHAQIPLDRLDLAHDHAGEPFHHRGDLLHADPRVGQAIGHRARVELGLHELLQPAERDLHRPGRPANCCRNRRSLSKKSRISSISYLSMAMRSMPMPKAQPVTSSGS